LKLFFFKVGEVETRLKFLELFLKFADFFLPFQQEVFVLVSFEFGGSEHTFDGKLLVQSGVSQLIFEFDVLVDFCVDLAQKFIIRVEVLDELAWRALVHTALHLSHVLVFHHCFTRSNWFSTIDIAQQSLQRRTYYSIRQLIRNRVDFLVDLFKVLLQLVAHLFWAHYFMHYYLHRSAVLL
jgi:hypothetical protein